MRKLIYYVATTFDGFIADSKGGVDAFLPDGPHYADMIADFPETFPTATHSAFGITQLSRVFDTVLMGRNTYDLGARHGVTSPYSHLEQYVFSRSMERSLDPAVTLVKSDAAGFVRELKSRQGRAIWLCGGGPLASALFDQIDEVVFKVNPVLLGAGMPVFGKPVPATRLKLIERRVYDNGVVRMHMSLR